MDSNSDFTLEKITDSGQKMKICGNILRNLPEWFGIEEAIVNYTREVKELTFFATKSGNQTVGFLSIKEHNPFSSEIHAMGVLKSFQGFGLGSKLIRLAEKELNQQRGKKFLMVKTLGESHPDPHYYKTRAFYKKMGFYPLEEMVTLWGEENPCLIMVKYINS